MIQTTNGQMGGTYAQLKLAYGKLNFFMDDYNLETYEQHNADTSMTISQEGFQEIEKSLQQLSNEIETRLKDGTLVSLEKQVKINPSHIEFKDPKTGLRVVATTKGLSYLVTPRGIIIQLTPNTIRVKDLDGKIRDMDVSQTKKALKRLTDDLSKEVKDWISGDIGLL